MVRVAFLNICVINLWVIFDRLAAQVDTALAVGLLLSFKFSREQLILVDEPPKSGMEPVRRPKSPHP
jgi:hypothetical protein